MFTTILLWAMAGIVAMFGLVALKVGAQYRFLYGHKSYLWEGLGFLGVAAYGALLASTAATGILVLGAGIAVGVGIRALGGNQRYLK